MPVLTVARLNQMTLDKNLANLPAHDTSTNEFLPNDQLDFQVDDKEQQRQIQ